MRSWKVKCYHMAVYSALWEDASHWPLARRDCAVNQAQGAGYLNEETIQFWTKSSVCKASMRRNETRNRSNSLPSVDHLDSEYPLDQMIANSMISRSFILITLDIWCIRVNGSQLRRHHNNSSETSNLLLGIWSTLMGALVFMCPLRKRILIIYQVQTSWHFSILQLWLLCLRVIRLTRYVWSHSQLYSCGQRWWLIWVLESLSISLWP